MQDDFRGSGTAPDEARKARTPKWYLAYFLLAAFDILTVSASLYLNHVVRGIYADSVVVNSLWATRLAQLAELRQLAGEVNAPGNDVFDSHDVPQETERMQTALKHFQERLAALQTEITTSGQDTAAALLLEGMQSIEVALTSMVHEAAQIFLLFVQNYPDKAGERMATMDRKYADVHAAFAHLEEKIRTLQGDHLRQQKELAATLQRYEILIALFILVMVSGACFYGHRIYIQMVFAAHEREVFLQRLSQAHTEAMEAARTKAEFLANMSHEIRTPMNGVLGMLDLLDHTQLDARQRRFLLTSRNSAVSLLAILNDILDFSKIEAGKLDLEQVDVELRALVEEVCALLAVRAHDKGLHLQWIIPDTVPVQVKGDPTRLRQVLTNLVSNAIKFTERGEIAMRVEATPLLADHEAAGAVAGLQRYSLHFAVTDTGIGIAPETQKRLFRSFTQADGSMTRRFGGTGLGLAISKQLVELMGGEIGCESMHGVGSRFWFTVPVELGTPEPAAKPQGSDRAEAKC